MRPPNRIHRKIVDKNDIKPPTDQNKNDSAAKHPKVNTKLKLDERF